MEVEKNAEKNAEKNKVKAVVLAAGKGTRLQTDDDDAPKVMRLARGRPLLRYVLDALSFISKEDVIIVVGYKKAEVIKDFSGYAFAEQTEQLGTGHAVMAAGDYLYGFDGSVLICYGDMPAVKRETYEALLEAHFASGDDCTILTGESTIDLPYGRVVRTENGDFEKIVEDRDCTPEQKKITELNSGVYAFKAELLLNALTRLNRDNSQGEYYLTDVPAIIRADGGSVGLFRRDLGSEILGVNTPQQLAQVEEILRIEN